MKYMLDTNIIIHYIRMKPSSVAEKINGLGDDAAPCMSFITYAELLKGAERSTRKAEVIRNLELLSGLIQVNYDISGAICGQYARHSSKLKASGRQIGANDLWIACHALSLDMTLVTNNVREFERIEGLRIENWA
ncbi:MAG: type II toxin-antitoxin system VapC family toxin [Burkholderiales bacterium]|nr:type II toxin-antitoxin system VapC family toxin [Burkholderiales bacterium]